VIYAWAGRRTTGGGLLNGVDWHVVGYSVFCWLSYLARADLGYSLLGLWRKGGSRVLLQTEDAAVL
jgi:hypothetical protein